MDVVAILVDVLPPAVGTHEGIRYLVPLLVLNHVLLGQKIFSTHVADVASVKRRLVLLEVRV